MTPTQIIEDLRHQRDALAIAIRDAAVNTGIIKPETELTGPQLLQLCSDLALPVVAKVQSNHFTVVLLRPAYLNENEGDKYGLNIYVAQVVAQDGVDAVDVAQKEAFDVDTADELMPRRIKDYKLCVLFNGHQEPKDYGWKVPFCNEYPEVIDPNTGLVWKCNLEPSIDFEEACEKYKNPEKDGWRIPSLDEIETLSKARHDVLASLVGHNQEIWVINKSKFTTHWDTYSTEGRTLDPWEKPSGIKFPVRMVRSTK